MIDLKRDRISIVRFERLLNGKIHHIGNPVTK